MIKQAVILAAGKGTRLRAGGNQLPKPLHVVAGEPLLRRTIRTLRQAGVEHVAVVVGYQSELIRNALEQDTQIADMGVTVRCIDNHAFEKSNGISVLAAGKVLQGNFLLSMSDHVYQPSVAALVANADMSNTDLVLAVDRRVAEVYDIDDATKVRTNGNDIVDIGKQLASYDCIDCGVFAVTTGLVAELAALYAKHGDCSLSAGVLALASKRRARVADIGDAFWQDVDTPEALQRAESEMQRLRLV
jgi:1L-myo-inositol 1-phosphate cytidylyltransferase